MLNLSIFQTEILRELIGNLRKHLKGGTVIRVQVSKAEFTLHLLHQLSPRWNAIACHNSPISL